MNFRKFGIAAISMLAAISPASAEGLSLNIEVSSESIDLPETRFTSLRIPTPLGQNQSFTSTRPFEDHDGNFDGPRLDLELRGGGIGSQQLQSAIKGFYSSHESSNSATCQGTGGGATLNGICTTFPLIDPATFIGSGLNTSTSSTADGVEATTKRDIKHFGVAAEIDLPILTDGTRRAPLRAGLAYREIDQKLFYSADLVRPGTFQLGTVELSEDMETGYFGGYIGIFQSLAVGANWTLSADGEIGLYDAETSYFAVYAANNRLNPSGTLTQELALNDDDTTYIGSLKLAAERDFGIVKLAVFGRGEYYSYVPEIRYNDREKFGGATQLFSGENPETALFDDEAWIYSIGGRITVPMGSGQ